MAEVKQGAGFRFTKLMGWGPAVVLIFAVLLVAGGRPTAGLLLAICGILFGFIVRRRMKRAAGGADGGA
jgi:cobalamin synthase